GCLAAPARSVNLPVGSITSSTPSCFHGSLDGSFSANTLIVDPPAQMLPSPDGLLGHSSHIPWTLSYRSRCCSVGASVRSFTATKSIASLRPLEARTTSLPMRPKPLIPTRTAMRFSLTRRIHEQGPRDPTRAEVARRRTRTPGGEAGGLWRTRFEAVKRRTPSAAAESRCRGGGESGRYSVE